MQAVIVFAVVALGAAAADAIYCRLCEILLEGNIYTTHVLYGA